MCCDNQLSVLQYLPNSLTELICYNNPLVGIVVPPNLKYLDCSVGLIEQFVSLPNTLEYFDCSMNKLSTLPPLPSSLTNLRCSGNSMNSIPSLPPSLIELDCSSNQLPYLPSLPSSLIYLYCGGNLLPILPTLPSSLMKLYCMNNNYYTLPTLPQSLRFLSCGGPFLNLIPQLPDSLNEFECSSSSSLTSLGTLPSFIGTIRCNYNNNLIQLPALPNVLYELYCTNNKLTSLPTLPLTLGKLSCNTNNLTSLPALPFNLRELSCTNNKLTNLPILNDSLSNLYCKNNLLASIPNFPNSLRNLDCANNQLTMLPNFPSSLNLLRCSNNPISCLPDLNKIKVLEFFNTQVNCLPGYGVVQTSTPSFAGFPLCDVNNSNGCSVFWNIEGSAYVDADTNCIIGTSETRVPNQKIKLYKNGVIDQVTYSNSNGDFDFNTSTFDFYSTQLDTSNSPFVSYCPFTGTYDDTISVADSMKYNRNFGLKCKGVDLAATSIFTFSLKPGSLKEIYLGVGDYSENFGGHCAAGVSGTIVVDFSGPCAYLSPASGCLSPSSIIGNTLTYNISDFGNLSFSNAIDFYILVDSTAVSGDQICIQVTISTTSTELDYNNNILSRCFSVVNSFDPNDKTVYPISTLDISGDRWLTYTIRFQNTGTASAENIYITDTISTDLDWTSFDLLSYSHQPLTQVYNDGLIKFNFPHINLPDSSSNEPKSHGFVQFKIRAKDSLAVGAIIENKANIFFDLNPPIITNTTSNTITNCSIPATHYIETICNSLNYELNNVIYSSSGTFEQKFITAAGCDSTVYLDLTFISNKTELNESICSGDVYFFGGQPLSNSGIYSDTLINSLGCDSVVILNLNVIQYYLQQTQTICQNDSILFGNSYLSQSGVYFDSLYSVSGCDSIIELNLIKSSFNNVISQNADTLQTSQVGTTYQWIDCSTNTFVAGATNRQFRPSLNGNYSVIVSDGLCTDTSNCINFSVPDLLFTDRYWAFGDSAGINFKNSGPQPANSILRVRGTCASICDNKGDLLFYAGSPNWIEWLNPAGPIKFGTVVNKNHMTMQNGDTLIGGLLYQEMAIVPYPGNDKLFYVFCAGVTTYRGLYYSTVDLNYNGGLGKVVQKNVQLRNDTLVDCIAVVRHGNGRDWWVLVRSWKNVPTNDITAYLITPSGITAMPTQHIGASVTYASYYRMKFNSDGTHLYNVCQVGAVERYDFDRCTGLLSNRIVYSAPGGSINGYWDFEISHDESKLYAVRTMLGPQQINSELNQFDLDSTTFISSSKSMATYSFPEMGGALKMGPDGKIYSAIAYYDNDACYDYLYCYETNNVTNTTLSVINQPDSTYPACDFQPYGFYLGGHKSYYGLPNNPKYELGKLVASPCDTLTVGLPNINEAKNELKLYYSSTIKTVFINAENLSGNKANLQFYNSSGQLIEEVSQTINGGYFTYSSSFSSQADGVYIIRLISDREVLTGKFVKR